MISHTWHKSDERAFVFPTMRSRPLSGKAFLFLDMHYTPKPHTSAAGQEPLKFQPERCQDCSKLTPISPAEFAGNSLTPAIAL